MNRALRAIRVMPAAVVLTCSFAISVTLHGSGAPSPQGDVVLIKLANPSYPPLARQTRIVGDVELMLEVRNNGSIQSAGVVKGHRLLKQAALDSAQHSQFECRKCPDGTVSYAMVYTFQLIGSEGCCTQSKVNANVDQQDQQVPRVTQSDNHVTLIDQPMCICDPAADVQKVRSMRCLYLWKCGARITVPNWQGNQEIGLLTARSPRHATFHLFGGCTAPLPCRQTRNSLLRTQLAIKDHL